MSARRVIPGSTAAFYKYGSFFSDGTTFSAPSLSALSEWSCRGGVRHISSTYNWNPEDSQAWFALGAAGGGTVSNVRYNEQQCFVKALELNPKDSRAWGKLGAAGGGTVSNVTYNEQECFVKALELNPEDSELWQNLGAVGGGTVSNVTYNQQQCLVKAVELNPDYRKT